MLNIVSCPQFTLDTTMTRRSGPGPWPPASAWTPPSPSSPATTSAPSRRREWFIFCQNKIGVKVSFRTLKKYLVQIIWLQRERNYQLSRLTFAQQSVCVIASKMVFPLTPGASSLSCKLASASCPLLSILADLTNLFSVPNHTHKAQMFRYTVPVKVQTQQPYQVKYFLWHVNIFEPNVKYFYIFPAEDVRLVLVHPAQVLPLQDPDEDRLQDRGSVSVCRYLNF